MYEYEGLHNVLYTMLYGAAAMAAIIVGLYLLLRRHNAIAPQINSPKSLRRWAAAFLFATAASHVWWTVIGTVFLADDRFGTLFAMDRNVKNWYILYTPIIYKIGKNWKLKCKKVGMNFATLYIREIVLYFYTLLCINIFFIKIMYNALYQKNISQKIAGSLDI